MTNPIARYICPPEGSSFGGSMIDDDNGDYVEYYDYAELAEQSAAQAARIEQLTAESVNEELREAVRASLGEALDCTRVWEAWSYGTMTEDDFVQVADDDERVEEIVCAVVEVIKSKLQAGEVQL